METCINIPCHKPMPWELRHCPACGTDNGLPNLRRAKHEQAALTLRYEAAMTDCKTRGLETTALDFAQKIQQDSHAVINGTASFFYSFFDDDRNLYTTYDLQIAGQMRTAAAYEDDIRRREVGSKVFGAYAKEIRYAALTLTGRGLTSYGGCSMVLNADICGNLASLTEENTYELVGHHPAGIPDGFRAVWTERHKLSLAKLAPKLTAATTPGHYAALLFFSEGRRATDQFIEVHLYGPFSCNSIKSASIPFTGANKKETHDLAYLFDKLVEKAIPCQRH
jgi:hypothetical protein